MKWKTKLRKAMADAKMSQRELARQTGIHHQTIHWLCSAKRSHRPHLSNAKKIETALEGRITAIDMRVGD